MKVRSCLLDLMHLFFILNICNAARTLAVCYLIWFFLRHFKVMDFWLFLTYGVKIKNNFVVANFIKWSSFCYYYYYYYGKHLTISNSLTCLVSVSYSQRFPFLHCRMFGRVDNIIRAIEGKILSKHKVENCRSQFCEQGTPHGQYSCFRLLQILSNFTRR